MAWRMELGVDMMLVNAIGTLIEEADFWMLQNEAYGKRFAAVSWELANVANRQRSATGGWKSGSKMYKVDQIQSAWSCRIPTSRMAF
jgi:hypothetical protein